MKKYLSFLLVLTMTLLASTQIVRAENTVKNVSDIANGLDKAINISTKNLTPEQKTAYMAARAKAEASLKTNIKTMRAEAKVKMDVLKENIKNEKDSAKAKIKELRISVRENAVKKFDIVVKRISDLDDKVKAQITKLGAKGVDVTNATSLEATVGLKLADIKVKITDATTLLSTSINELTPDQKTALKTLTKDIQTLLNDAHTALNSAVKSLKDATKTKMETDTTPKTETTQ